MNSLKQLIQKSPYQGYAYSYPHKLAYRPFEPGIDLQKAWEQEKKDACFLYLHIPFCEMRCGFCNLFTMANPKSAYEHPYLAALKRQIETLNSRLGKLQFARLAIGGGTPTFLSLKDLNQVFNILKNSLNYQAGQFPVSIEMSPKTTSKEKLALLKENDCTRASIGIQSFLEAETKALGRPQKISEVEQALSLIKASRIPILNIDLIYGQAMQTKTSWQYSLEQSLQYDPEELFLYPLYVRPLTGLGIQNKEWDDFRFELYCFGRDFLLARGYEQINMRLFRKQGQSPIKAPAYKSMEDPMLGLGVGARSYTKQLHYSSDYAVGRKGVKQIIADYNTWEAPQFSKAWYGIQVKEEEQKRRYLIKSLLEYSELDYQAYKAYFNSSAQQDFPCLEELLSANFASEKNERLVLNMQGIAYSDVIGPWLYSKRIQEEMKEFSLV